MSSDKLNFSTLTSTYVGTKKCGSLRYQNSRFVLIFCLKRSLERDTERKITPTTGLRRLCNHLSLVRHSTHCAATVLNFVTLTGPISLTFNSSSAISVIVCIRVQKQPKMYVFSLLFFQYVSPCMSESEFSEDLCLENNLQSLTVVLPPNSVDFLVSYHVVYSILSISVISRPALLVSSSS